MYPTTILALWRAGFEQAAVAQAAATTIALRLPILATQVTRPDLASHRETHKMVHEKMAATIEGAHAGLAVWQRMWIDAAFGKMTVETAVNGALAAASAAGAPARRRAAANATRLTKRALKR